MEREDRPDGYRGSLWSSEEWLELHSGASGILRHRPRAVAVPEDADDLATLVRWCADRRIPLVPRGAATGMPGGNVGAGVAVDMLSPFRRVVSLDPERRVARVEPGVTLAELNAAAAPHGLHFPVDPSSGARCTLGGMIANNAAGARSVRYGATREWVEALSLVLADGRRAEVRRGERPGGALADLVSAVGRTLEPHRDRIEAAWPRVRKNSSGYALREFLRSADAVDLLVGSEGTLALVVEAELRLAPLPPARGLALLEFADLAAAGAAVLRILEHRPATCEILDRTFLELVRDAGVELGYPLRDGVEAILLVEVTGADGAAVAEALEALRAHVGSLADRVATATDPALQASFWSVRRAASPIIGNRTDDRFSMQFIEDGVVPVERLPDYILALRRILGAHGVPAVIFGHAGDGNLHVNPLVDVADPAWRDTVEAILRETAEAVRDLGGTLAGEHGDGRLRAPLLETIWGAEMVALFRSVKDAWDPEGLLNPGVILPLPGQRPLDALRDFRPRTAPG